MERTALLLELIGFTIASLFIALLKIDIIKSIADGIKRFIHKNFEQSERSINLAVSRKAEPTRRHIMWEFLMLLLSKPSIIMKQLSLIIFDCFEYLISKDEIRTLIKTRITDRFAIVLLTLKMIYTSAIGLFWGFLTYFVHGFTYSKYLLFRSLAPPEIITKSLIIFGSILILVGLILETITVFSTT